MRARGEGERPNAPFEQGVDQIEVEAQRIFEELKSGKKRAKMPEGPVGERARALWQEYLTVQQGGAAQDRVPTERLPMRLEVSIPDKNSDGPELTSKVVERILADKQLRGLVCILLGRPFEQRGEVLSDDVRTVRALFPDRAHMVEQGMQKVRALISSVGVEGKGVEAAQRKQQEYWSKFNALLDLLYGSEGVTSNRGRTRFEVTL